MFRSPRAFSITNMLLWKCLSVISTLFIFYHQPWPSYKLQYKAGGCAAYKSIINIIFLPHMIDKPETTYNRGVFVPRHETHEMYHSFHMDYFSVLMQALNLNKSFTSSISSWFYPV